MRRSTMFVTSTSVLVVTTTVLAIIASACGGSDQAATQPSATAYNQQYPPQQYPQQYPPQQQPYPQQQPVPQTQPTMAPQPQTAGTMATPGPLALPCQNDGACGTHKCNMQFQKCAFPCQTAVDCGQGNNCMMGICAPGMAPQQ